MFRIVRRVAIALFIVGAAVTLWQRRVDRRIPPPHVQSEVRMVAVDVVPLRQAVAATPGWHLVTLPFDELLSVAGLIQPDSRIDVLVLPRVGAGEKRRVETIAEDLRVLAVGSGHSRSPEGRPIRPSTVNVEVKSKAEVERLVDAMSRGELRYTLRGHPGAVAVAPAAPTAVALLSEKSERCTNQRGDTQVYDAVRLSCMSQQVAFRADSSTVRILPPR